MYAEEEKRRILDTAEKLRPMIATEGWKFVAAYCAVRVESLKNKIANTNLSDKLVEAAQNQGEIKAFKKVVDRVNEIIAQAKKIEEMEIKNIKKKGKT